MFEDAHQDDVNTFEATLRSSTDEDLLCVPGICLGFHPTESCVVLGVCGTSVEFCARADLDWLDEGRADLIRQVEAAAQSLESCNFVILGYTRYPDENSERLIRLALEIHGTVMDVLIASPTRYWTVTPLGLQPPEGYPWDPGTTTLAAEAVYLGTHWEPITIDIDLRQLLNNIEAEKGPEDREQSKPTHADYAHAAYVLLGLVLAELSAGTLPLGSRSTRGLGQVVVTTIEVEGADRKGVDLPSWNLTGCEALQQPATGAGVMTDALYKGQRELAGRVLCHLKNKYEKTDWSKRLENGPGAARKPSERTEAADD